MNYNLLYYLSMEMNGQYYKIKIHMKVKYLNNKSITDYIKDNSN